MKFLFYLCGYFRIVIEDLKPNLFAAHKFFTTKAEANSTEGFVTLISYHLTGGLKANS